MKKLVLAVLLCMCFLFIACGKKESVENTEKQQEENMVNEPDKQVSSENEKKEASNGTEGPITVEMVRTHKPASPEEFEIEESETAVRIKKYVGSAEIVVVPELINGKPVTGIDGYTFGNTSKVRGIMLPETIKGISFLSINNQFLEVVICEGVEDFGESCFHNNGKLHTIVMGNGVKNLGVSPFAICTSLKELYIPSEEATCAEWMIPELFMFCPDITIYGVAGSPVEEYAKQNNVKFVAQ